MAVTQWLVAHQIYPDTVHHGDMSSFTFSGMERVHLSERDSDLYSRLLEREVFRIHKLATRFPFGLNHCWDLDIFLKLMYQLFFVDEFGYMKLSFE